jgi:hypothetical protein
LEKCGGEKSEDKGMHHKLTISRMSVAPFDDDWNFSEKHLNFLKNISVGATVG